MSGFYKIGMFLVKEIPEKNTLVVEKQGNFRIEHKLSASHSKEDLIDIIIRSDKAGTDNDKRQTSFLLKDMYVTKT